MSDLKSYWQDKYPSAFCWSFGDSPALADELAALVIAGKKRGTCGSLASYQQEQPPVTPGHITLCWTAKGKPSA
jgi:uncharacterized protein YhfF